MWFVILIAVTILLLIVVYMNREKFAEITEDLYSVNMTNGTNPLLNVIPDTCYSVPCCTTTDSVNKEVGTDKEIKKIHQ